MQGHSGLVSRVLLSQMAEADSSQMQILRLFVTFLCFVRFTRAVEGLLRISEYHRLELLKGIRQIRKDKEGGRTPSSQNHDIPPTVPEEEEEWANQPKVGSSNEERILHSRYSSSSVDSPDKGYLTSPRKAMQSSPSRVFRNLPPVRLCTTPIHWIIGKPFNAQNPVQE